MMQVPTGWRPKARRPGSPISPIDVPGPPRMRRRPLILAASIIAVCLGALLTVWAWTATTSSTEVVAVRSTVMRGELLERADLMTVRIGADPSLRTVPADQLESLVGQRTVLDVAAGGLLTADAVSRAVVPPAGSSLVGVALQPGMLPATPLQPGDRVRFVLTPGSQGDTATPATSLDGTVQQVTVLESGQSIVDALVPAPRAGELAAQASTGRVVLVLDSRER